MAAVSASKLADVVNIIGPYDVIGIDGTMLRHECFYILFFSFSRCVQWVDRTIWCVWLSVENTLMLPFLLVVHSVPTTHGGYVHRRTILPGSAVLLRYDRCTL